MNFRGDINALRAIAVIAVVVFHFEPSWLKGGFAGVDVFFVISGYLMTGIIFRRFEKGTFNLFEFYVARASRIIPALAMLCFALLIFSFVYLTPFDYPSISNHIKSSILLYSNITYLNEAGYFDVASNEKWLLHTWSLSVEWQFYILYPIVLIALKQFFTIKNIKWLIVLFTLVGFGYSVYLTLYFPEAAYFSITSRAWEMLMGGVAFFFPLSISKHKAKLIQGLGVSLIIASYVLVDKASPWPGVLALLPVVGTLLVIMSNANSGYLINNRLVQTIGTWSYSIYLWHWPVVVYGNYFGFDDWWMIGLPLSFFFGYISYTFVESIKLRPFNHLRQTLKVKPVWFVVLIFFAGSQLADSDIQGGDDNDNRLYTSALSAIGDWQYPKPNLNIDGLKIRYIEGSSDKNILFIGASHVEQTYPYVKLNSSKYNIYYLTMGGCSFVPSAAHPRWSCQNIQRYKELFEEVEFSKVVTSLYCIYCGFSRSEQTKELRIREYDEFLKFAKNHSEEFFMVKSEPFGKEFDPRKSVRYKLAKQVSVTEVRKKHKKRNEALDILSELDGVQFIDPVDYLCTDVCKTMNKNYEFYYKDSSHMRPWYAEKYLSYLDIIIK